MQCRSELIIDSFIASEGIELPCDTFVFCFCSEILCVIILRVMCCAGMEPFETLSTSRLVNVPVGHDYKCHDMYE